MIVQQPEYYATRVFYFHLYYEQIAWKGNLRSDQRYEFRVDDIYEKNPGGIVGKRKVYREGNGQRLSGLGLALEIWIKRIIYSSPPGVVNPPVDMDKVSFFFWQ